MTKRIEKAKLAGRARAALSKVDKLTTRQVDMVVLAIMAMPVDASESMLKRIEKDPESILSELRIPVKRH